MFKFNFNENEEKVEKETVIEKKNDAKVLKKSEKTEISSNQYEKVVESIENQSFEMFTTHEIEIGYLDNLQITENSESDLVAGVYEGGFKIWECTQDLADYFTSEESKTNELEGKICDFGCSAGILGILSLIKGAKAVDFQDYNEDVLEKFTIPNVILYCEESEVPESFSKCSFYSGDWDSFKELTANEEKYDIILTSETIYNPANYSKLLNFFKSRLKKDSGKVFLAAKSHYFGVGGNTFDFCKFIEKDGDFSCEIVWKSSEGLQREIILIKWR